MTATREDHDPVHRFVRVHDQSWHVVEAGSGSTVMLLAGFPQSWYAWRHVIPRLAQTHRVIAVDLPGQGDSGESSRGYDSWTIAEVLLALCDHLEIHDLVLVGHDVGAWVSYAFAHRYPERLRGVGLVDGNIAAINLELNAETSWGGWHFVFNRVPDLPELLFAGRERVVIEWFFERSALDWRATFTAEDVDEYVRVLSRPGTLRGMLGYYRAVPDNEVRNRQLSTGRLTVPTLALVGGTSGSNGLAAGLRSQADVLRSVVLENARHYVAEEQPDAVVSALRDFMASLPERAPGRADEQAMPGPGHTRTGA